MKFREGSPLLRELELDLNPLDEVQPILVPEGFVLCSKCNKVTPKITSTTGSELVENPRTGEVGVELLKTERIIGPFDDFTVPGWKTFDKKQAHFTRQITVCPNCALSVGEIKFPPMRG